MRQPIHLYFGARDERDIYHEAHFRALAARHDNLRYTAVLSQPRRGTARRVGLVHEVVAGDLADLDGAKAYLAGPPPMVEAATALVVDKRAAAFTESIASPSAAAAAVALAVERFGGLDIVVNNAAIIRDGFIFKADPLAWDAVIRTNLSAPFHILAAATPVMREQTKALRGGTPYSWGRIVNIVSTAGLYGNYGQAAYASAKAGLLGLTRVVALDMQRSLVTCNAVAPFAATRVTESIKPANPAQASYKEHAMKVPARAVAELVAWLAGPDAAQV